MIQAGKKNADAQSLAFFLSVEGDLYLEQAQFEKAESVYTLALKKQPLLPAR